MLLNIDKVVLSRMASKYTFFHRTRRFLNHAQRNQPLDQTLTQSKQSTLSFGLFKVSLHPFVYA